MSPSVVHLLSRPCKTNSSLTNRGKTAALPSTSTSACRPSSLISPLKDRSARDEGARRCIPRVSGVCVTHESTRGLMTHKLRVEGRVEGAQSSTVARTESGRILAHREEWDKGADVLIAPAQAHVGKLRDAA